MLTYFVLLLFVTLPCHADVDLANINYNLDKIAELACLSSDLPLVNVQRVARHIIVDIDQNRLLAHTAKDMYPSHKGYCHKEVAVKLACVDNDLRSYGYGLKLRRAYCPLSIHKELSLDARLERIHYLKYLPRYSKGTSVAVVLVDSEGHELGMPTPWDVCTEKSRIDTTLSVTEDEIFNRTLLQTAMLRHGFVACPDMWWHFDLKGHAAYPEYNVSYVDLDHLDSVLNSDPLEEFLESDLVNLCP